MQPSFNPYAPPQAAVHRRREPGDGELELAELAPRLLAALIDLSPQLLLLAAIVYARLTGAARPQDEHIYLAIGLGMFALIPYQLYQWYLITVTGQSIGKRRLGLQIVRTHDLPAGFVHGVLLRSWAPGLTYAAHPVIALLWCLVDPLPIFDARRRCLHDYIAGTRVVVAPRA